MKSSRSSVEDGLGVALLDVGAVVLDQLVRMEDVAADLAAEAGVQHLAPLARELGLAPLLLVLGEAALEDPQRRLAVRELRALVLALDDDPGGEVGDADGRVGLVHVLAAGAARAVGVDAEVGLVDLDVDVVGDERADDHLRERRVAPVRLVERREAHEPVHAALGLEDPVGVLALDGERRRLEARLLAGRGLDQLGLEPAVGRPSAGTCAAGSPPSPARPCRPCLRGWRRRRRPRRTRR